MLFPKYVLEDLYIGSGSIIGKDNIEEFFKLVSKHKDVEDRSLAELAPIGEEPSASPLAGRRRRQPLSGLQIARAVALLSHGRWEKASGEPH
jgi:hypothetical protein